MNKKHFLAPLLFLSCASSDVLASAHTYIRFGVTIFSAGVLSGALARPKIDQRIEKISQKSRSTCAALQTVKEKCQQVLHEAGFTNTNTDTAETDSPVTLTRQDLAFFKNRLDQEVGNEVSTQSEENKS